MITIEEWKNLYNLCKVISTIVTMEQGWNVIVWIVRMGEHCMFIKLDNIFYVMNFLVIITFAKCAPNLGVCLFNNEW